MLAASLGRNVGHGSLEDFQQCLLHTLTGNIAGDGDILGGLANLVGFIDEDDAALRLGHVVIGGHDQLEQQVLHVFTHVPRFSERGRIADGQGHVENAGEGLRHQRLSAAGGADHQDVGFLDLHIFFTLRLFAAGESVEMNETTVMQMDRHREGAFRLLLTDDVALQFVVELAWTGHFIEGARRGFGDCLTTLLWIRMDDHMTEIDAVGADEKARRAGNQARSLMGLLAAETAAFLA